MNEAIRWRQRVARGVAGWCASRTGVRWIVLGGSAIARWAFGFVMEPCDQPPPFPAGRTRSF